MLAEAVLQLLGEVLLNFHVALTDGGGVEEEEVVVVFEVFKARPVAEGEVDLVAVPELEGDDFMPLFAQDADGFEQSGGIVEKVADDDEEPAALEALGEGLDDWSEAGVPTGCRLHHSFEQQVEVGDLRSAGDVLAELRVEGDEAYGVLLAHEQVGEGGGELAGVVEFEDALASPVVHAAAGIEDDGGAEIGLLVVLADVKAVAAAEDLPVEAADFITLNVGAVLAEFDAETLVRRGVVAGGEAFDNGAREELQLLQGRDVFGLENVAESSHLWEIRSLKCGGKE